jgi:hypothetical protein
VDVALPLSSRIVPGLSYQLLITSKLLYDWQFTANQFVLVPSLLRLTTRDFFSTETLL